MRLSDKLCGAITAAIGFAVGGSQLWSAAEGWTATIWKAEWRGTLFCVVGALLSGVAVGIWIVKLTDVKAVETELTGAKALANTYREAAEKVESSSQGRIIEKELEVSRLASENRDLMTRLAALTEKSAEGGTSAAMRTRSEAEIEQIRQNHEREWLMRINGIKEKPEQLNVLRTVYRDGAYEANGLDLDVAALFSVGVLTTSTPPTQLAKGIWSLRPQWREFIDDHPGILDNK